MYFILCYCLYYFFLKRIKLYGYYSKLWDNFISLIFLYFANKKLRLLFRLLYYLKLRKYLVGYLNLIDVKFISSTSKCVHYIFFYETIKQCLRILCLFLCINLYKWVYIFHIIWPFMISIISIPKKCYLL